MTILYGPILQIFQIVPQTDIIYIYIYIYIYEGPGWLNELDRWI
jgi:hypothetical protein